MCCFWGWMILFERILIKFSIFLWSDYPEKIISGILLGLGWCYLSRDFFKTLWYFDVGSILWNFYPRPLKVRQYKNPIFAMTLHDMTAVSYTNALRYLQKVHEMQTGLELRMPYIICSGIKPLQERDDWNGSVTTDGTNSSSMFT